MKMTTRIIALALIYSFFLSILFVICGSDVRAAEYNDSQNEKSICVPSADKLPLIVTMGDSYSSGEGNEPFYDQVGVPEYKKVTSQDWLAHRSKEAWAGKIEFDIFDGTDHHYGHYNNIRNYRWFFVASSGATTKDIFYKQEKTYQRKETNRNVEKKATIDAQIDVFSKNNLKGKVDYVTLTLGGNDVGFESIIEAAVKESVLLDLHALDNELKKAWTKYYLVTQFDLLNVYASIQEAAGEQAKILVIGYPPLINDQKRTIFFGIDEALEVNRNVLLFNEEIKKLINEECPKLDQKMNIEFISIYEEFKTHEAYTKNNYINEIKYIQSEDIDVIGGLEAYFTETESETKFDGVGLELPISAYSIHPNIAGQEKIAEIVQEYLMGPASAVNTVGEDIINVAETLAPTDTPTPTPTPTNTPTPTPNIDMDVLYSSYREILHDHEHEMRTVENSNMWRGTKRTCAVTDLNGDDVPELLILYCSDEENGKHTGSSYEAADARIYTVLPGGNTATEMLHIPKVVLNWDGGTFSDVVYLSNGNILFRTYLGNGDFNDDSYVEYSLNGYFFQQENILEYESHVIDYDNWEYEKNYSYNGESISESDFDAKLADYQNAFASVLISNPQYEFVDKDKTSDWVLAMLDTQNSSMTFDEAWELINLNLDYETLTEEQINTALTNYLDAEYGVLSYDGSAPCYWGIGSIDGNVANSMFRAYTGSITYYHTYLNTGYTYVTLYNSKTGKENPTDEYFNMWDYLE